MLKQSFLVTDPAGLHARPVSIMAEAAGKFKSTIELEFGNKKANLKSILSVMTLGVTSNSTIVLYVDGEDEEEALARLIEILKTNKVAE